MYGRPIGTKLEDVAQAQEQMGETGKTVAGLLCEWCDWGIALSDGFQWYDSIGMLPIIPTSFGDNIGRFVAKYSDEAIVALRNVPAFQKFARWSFRENLARLTGFMPTNQFEAHHVLPQKYVQRFSDAGINIHDPIYGSWVEKTSHSQPIITLQRSNKFWMLPNNCQRGMDSMSTSLNYAEFYVMDDPLGNQALRLDFGAEMEWMNNDIAWALYRGQIKKTDKPINLKGYMGRRPMDVLWTGYPPLQSISDKVVELLTDNKISGWSTYPVTALDRDQQLLPGYHGFAVTGRGGTFDRSKSQIITKPAPGKSYQVYKGYYFKAIDWDGSDIFLVSNRTVITQRVKRLLEKAKIRNIRLTILPDFETDTYLDKFRDT